LEDFELGNEIQERLRSKISNHRMRGQGEVRRRVERRRGEADHSSRKNMITRNFWRWSHGGVVRDYTMRGKILQNKIKKMDREMLRNLDVHSVIIFGRN
jgi:hypothetical protein